MVWAKLDDDILDNPKIAEAGVLGFALFVAGITWCCRNLTDGFIPRGRVSCLLEMPDAKGVAQKLIELGLWDEAEGGYQVHDFLVYNPSREKVLAERFLAAERKAKSRLVGHRRSHAVTPTVTPVLVTPAPVPVPVPLNQERERARDVGKTTIPESFTLTAERKAYAQMVPLTDIEAVFRTFVAHWQSEAKLSADWDAEWRKWAEREKPKQATARGQAHRAAGSVARIPVEAPPQPYHRPFKRQKAEDAPIPAQEAVSGILAVLDQPDA
jgi:hypothetical protein